MSASGAEPTAVNRPMLSYEAARNTVIQVLTTLRPELRTERLELSQALGRVLAESVAADRDYPPFPRSTRDGFAVCSADVAQLPASLELIGEIKAGESFSSTVGPKQAVRIMTGAAVPLGADAVVMIEHATVRNNFVEIDRAVQAGQNIVARGTEASSGRVVLKPGQRLGYAELALLAQFGHDPVTVFRRPRVAILSTGDEVVAVEEKPGPFQIRNSNGISIAAQAELAGAEVRPLGHSPDRAEKLRAWIETGLFENLLVISGGVSMGRFDLVEPVLRQLGAELIFDAVAIRPGRPTVFAICRERCVFGLPGNPVSTMVTFELFVLPAIDILSGASPRPLTLFPARLEHGLKQKAVLTHFLPARLSWSSPDGAPTVRELPWQGSGDVVALAQADCFLVVPEFKLEWAAGEWIRVLPRRGMF